MVFIPFVPETDIQRSNVGGEGGNGWVGSISGKNVKYWKNGNVLGRWRTRGTVNSSKFHDSKNCGTFSLIAVSVFFGGGGG